MTRCIYCNQPRANTQTPKGPAHTKCLPSHDLNDDPTLDAFANTTPMVRGVCCLCHLKALRNSAYICLTCQKREFRNGNKVCYSKFHQGTRAIMAVDFQRSQTACKACKKAIQEAELVKDIEPAHDPHSSEEYAEARRKTIHAMTHRLYIDKPKRPFGGHPDFIIPTKRKRDHL